MTSDQQEEFDAFFLANAQRIVGRVALVTGDRALAEDATQEAFVRAHRRWGEVGRHDRPDAWVARVASRIAIDRWRKERRREDSLSNDVAVPHDGLVERLWVEWGLTHLSPRQREVVIMKYEKGMEVEAIAEHIGASRETIKTHLDRARQKLRTVLGKADV